MSPKLFGRHFIADGDMDQAFAVFGCGILDLVDFAHAADFFFDGPGDQAFDFRHRHAGIFGRHHRFTNRDEGVFQFRKAHERIDTPDSHQQYRHDDGPRIIKRKCGDPFHYQFPCCCISLTFMPSAKKLTPATAMMSPAARPSVTMGFFCSAPRKRIGVFLTIDVWGS